MDIGKEEKTHRIEPIEQPIPARTTKPARKTIPRREPTRTPERTPARTPSKR